MNSPPSISEAVEGESSKNDRLQNVRQRLEAGNALLEPSVHVRKTPGPWVKNTDLKTAINVKTKIVVGNPDLSPCYVVARPAKVIKTLAHRTVALKTLSHV